MLYRPQSEPGLWTGVARTEEAAAIASHLKDTMMLVEFVDLETLEAIEEHFAKSNGAQLEAVFGRAWDRGSYASSSCRNNNEGPSFISSAEVAIRCRP